MTRVNLPTLKDNLPVFSTVVFFVYGWALYRFFFHVPSWLYYWQIWDVLVLACYVLAYALVESLLVFTAVWLLALLLPKRWLRECFAICGTSLVALLALGAFLLQRKAAQLMEMELGQLVLYPLLALLAILLAAWGLNQVYRRVPLLERLARELANRMVIFAYLYPPLSLIGLIVVLVRNLF